MEGRGWPFSGGCSFYMKNKLKSELFNRKKIYKKMFFSFMTKNFNWEISTKNFVTFKRWDGFNDKKKLILWEFTENSDFFSFEGGEGCESPKRRGLDSL